MKPLNQITTELAENPNQLVQAQRQKERSKDWATQISQMVTQCYDSLNIYGKEPEQVENMILMFVHALQEYELPEIQKAFVDWIKGHGEMPTPSGIIEIIHANKPKPPQKYEHSSPEEYERAAQAKRNPKAVQWYGKIWPYFSSDDKQKLASHLVALGAEKAENYRLFLQSNAGAPSDLFYQLSVSFKP